MVVIEVAWSLRLCIVQDDGIFREGCLLGNAREWIKDDKESLVLVMNLSGIKGNDSQSMLGK